MFDESPNWNEHVSFLIRKGSKRKFVLNHYAGFMPGNDLKTLYCVLVRSILEYSAVTLATQISKYQSNRLEIIPKQCLRIMYGYGKSYDKLLQLSGLRPLSERRDAQFKKIHSERGKKSSVHQMVSFERRQTGNQKLKSLS